MPSIYTLNGLRQGNLLGGDAECRVRRCFRQVPQTPDTPRW